MSCALNRQQAITSQYFELYTKQGMEIIPVYKNSKTPIGKKWNQNYDFSKNKDYIEINDCNIGCLLGDVIDVEGDTKEANDLLNEMIGEMPHPIYRSSKSLHHIFKNTNKAIKSSRFNGIEFRSYGCQSVLPPSIHEDGTEYMWIKGTMFPIPEIPKNLLNYYFANRTNTKKRTRQKPPPRKIQPDFMKSFCTGCKRFEFIHKKRLKLEVLAFRKHQIKWSCHKCRTIDVREDCRILRKSIEI